MLTSPIKKLKGKPIITTLGYGDTSFAKQYAQLGWSIRAHNGIDYVCGRGREDSYGLPIIATQNGIIQRVDWDNPMSTKGNGIIFQGDTFAHEGKTKMLCEVFWHLSEITVKAGQRVSRGETIGYMGNSGYVIGDATNVFGGTHLHYMVYEYHLEGTWKIKGDNPLTNNAVTPDKWLNPNWKNEAPEIDKIEIEKQLHPFKWALDKISAIIKGWLK